MKKKFEVFVEAMLSCLGEIILLAIIAIFMVFCMTGCENPEKKEDDGYVKAIEVKPIETVNSKAGNDIMDLISVKFKDGSIMEYELPLEWADICISPNNKKLMICYDCENWQIWKEYRKEIEDFKIMFR